MQDTRTPEQGIGSFFKEATLRIRDLHCSGMEDVFTQTHARLGLHRENVAASLEFVTSLQQQTPIFKHTHAQTRTTLSPPKLHPTV